MQHPHDNEPALVRGGELPVKCVPSHTHDLAVVPIQCLVHAQVRRRRHARLSLLVTRPCGELELEDLEKARVAAACNPALPLLVVVGGGLYVSVGAYGRYGTGGVDPASGQVASTSAVVAAAAPWVGGRAGSGGGGGGGRRAAAVAPPGWLWRAAAAAAVRTAEEAGNGHGGGGGAARGIVLSLTWSGFHASE